MSVLRAEIIFDVAQDARISIMLCNFVSQSGCGFRISNGDVMEIEQGAGKIAKCLKLMLNDKPGHWRA